MDYPGTTTAAVDQEAAWLRDALDGLPHVAEELRAAHSPWHDGATLAVRDVLCVYRERGEQAMIARLWAWDGLTGG